MNADTLLGVKGKLLSHNLFAYCYNNSVNNEDGTGHIASLAAGAGYAFLQWAINALGVGAIGFWGYQSSKDRLERAKENVSSSAKTVSVSKISDKTDWGDDTKKLHVVEGSRKNGGHDWKKFNIDPNDPNAWDKILPLIKRVVDEVSGTPTRNNPDVIVFEKYFEEFGAGIKVFLYKLADGTYKLGDAYPLR